MNTLTFKNKDEMPAIGLGTWKSRPNEVYGAVKAAIAAGYRHIDCAAIYGNEKEVGQALKEAMASGQVRREDLWITSKLWNNAHRQSDVGPALDSTLEDLGLDYLDLYLIHWPVAVRPEIVFPSQGSDFISLDQIPVMETWQGMTDCLDRGNVRHIGVSNFSLKKLRALTDQADILPEMNQIELHPFLLQKEMLAYCRSAGVLLTAYSPLGSGDRPSALKAENEPGLLDNETIIGIAGKNNCTPAQVLIRWAVQRGTAVIPKSVDRHRMAENLAAGQLSLSEEDMETLSTLDRGYRYVSGHFWTLPGSPYTLGNIWDESP